MSNIEAKECCESCMFYHTETRTDRSSYVDRKYTANLCRRYPPRLDSVSGDIEEGSGWIGSEVDFPTVKSSNWCGEYRAKQR